MNASSGFGATRWSLVLRARGQTPEARAALSELCEAYWKPVFRFLQREGRGEDVARELAQEFFSRLLARSGLEAADPGRGRFRSYLLGALKHFLGDARDRELAQKRGAGWVHESLDAAGGMDRAGEASEVLQVPDPTSETRDVYFDREWALAVMERALTGLETEFREAGKPRQFEALKGWLAGESAVSQADAARDLAMSEGAVKVAVHRLRKRFGERVRAELLQTLPEGADPAEELGYLVEVLSGRKW